MASKSESSNLSEEDSSIKCSRKILSIILIVAMVVSLGSPLAYATGTGLDYNSDTDKKSKTDSVQNQDVPKGVDEDNEDVTDSNVVATGTCGDSLTWVLDNNGLLTISGTGEMYNYSYDSRPWYGYIANIESIVISDGVTSIGGNAFSECSSLTSVTIPDSVTFIAGYAFSDCTSLTDVYYDGTASQWQAITIVDSGNDCLTSAIIHYMVTDTAV